MHVTTEPMDKESGRIFLCRCIHYGLCNRLVYLVSSKAIAEVSGGELKCIWKPSFECDAQWHELFANADWFASSDTPTAEIESLSVGKVWFNLFYLKYVKDICSWEEFRRVVLHYLVQLQPREDIHRQVRSCIRDEEYVALHIRLTDNVRCFRKTKRAFVQHFALLEDYLDIITRETDTGLRAFVATDNRQVQQEIEHRYRDKVFFLDKLWRHQHCFVPRRNFRLASMFQEKRTTPITAALADLLLLSGAQRLYGTWYSTYSKLAATMGGIADFYLVTRAGAVRSKDVDMMLRDGAPHDDDDES
jgi:hypothetical protein